MLEHGSPNRDSFEPDPFAGLAIPSAGARPAPNSLDIENALEPYEEAASALFEVGEKLKFLQSLQPIEATRDTRDAFLKGTLREPVFTYHSRADEMRELRERLEPFATLEFEERHPIASPIVSRWIKEKIEERLQQISLIEARGNLVAGTGSTALEISKSLHGVPDAESVAQAEASLASLARENADKGAPRTPLTPRELEARINERFIEPWFNGTALPAWKVTVNPNANVTRCFNSSEEGTLYLGNRTYYEDGADRLSRHEMLHVFRSVLGLSQPPVLRELLSCGLAGYEATEEGLALTAEMEGMAMPADRAEMLHARTIAADSAVKLMSFREAFERLTYLGVPDSKAYNAVFGVYRGGGLLKDALYEKGYFEIRELMANGCDLNALFVGKISVSHIADAQVLLSAGFLSPPAAVPPDFELFFPKA